MRRPNSVAEIAVSKVIPKCFANVRAPDDAFFHRNHYWHNRVRAESFSDIKAAVQQGLKLQLHQYCFSNVCIQLEKDVRFLQAIRQFDVNIPTHL